MTEPNGRDTGRQIRRWGPVVAIVVVVAIVLAVVVVSGGDDDDGDVATVTDPTGDPDSTLGADTISWSQAEEQGITDEIDWGDRCDTERGTLAYPDFFAAECYAPFDGDNGGATAKGVTEDSIKVVYYLNQPNDPIYDYITSAIANDDTNQQIYDTALGFVEFYERFFETYGRSVDLVLYEGTGGSSDEVAARADAKAIADMEPFAVWGGPTLAGVAFREELAANEVLHLGLGGSRAEFAQERDPYIVAIPKSTEQSRLLLAEYVGKRLAGRDAVHSGDFTDQERVFGLVYIESSEESTAVADRFEEVLADEYGVDLAVKVPYALDPASIKETAATVIARLKEAGVTSVIVTTDPIAPREFTTEATAQDYFPEWVLAGTALVDTSAFARTYDQQQWEHAFGMSNTAARTRREVAGYYFLYDWFHGAVPPAPDTVAIIAPYHAVFFSVIQGVGPDLTPRNFVDALFASEPTARGGLTVPSLSWGDKGVWPGDLEPDYLGVDDVSEIWWDPAETGPDEIGKEGQGMYQYVDGGTRYLPGEWPESEPNVFDPEGAVSLYEERPPEETPPDYPSPAG